MALSEQKKKAVCDRALISKPQSAFTLVELLVVIAMITVLVGVIAPVTIQSRNKARAAACLSNLRQLSDALLAYSEDWNDRLPSLSSSQFAGGYPTAQWPEGSCATQLRSAISKYVKSSNIYRCGNDFGSPEYGFDCSKGSVFSRTGSSYLPWSAAQTGLYGIRLNGERISSYTSTSGICILRDYGSDWHGYRKRAGLNIEVTTVANAAYADGHAAPMPIFSVNVSDRGYACYALSRTDTVFISGGSGDVQVELSGRQRTNKTASGQPCMQLCVSGTAGSANSHKNIDRVFTFSSGTKINAAFRQIAAWADSQAAR